LPKNRNPSKRSRAEGEAGRKLGFAVENLIVDDPADLAKALTPEVLAGFDAFVFTPMWC
jgi:hypothetical protein